MRHCSALVLLLALGRPVLAADSFPINVYPCPRTESAPVLDGKLDDAVWQQAPVVSGFTLYETGVLATPQTAFRVLWDDQCLYFGVHCDEPLIGKVIAVRQAHDEHAMFRSETVEVFVDPDHTHERYYQIAFGIAGSLYDGEGMAVAWSSNAQLKTWSGTDGWSAEIAVPWQPMRAKPKAGKVVGFNVSRGRNVGEAAYSDWVRVDPALGFHDAERFAHLVLSGTPETVGKLATEFRKGGRTGPLAVYSAEGFAQTSYKQLAAAAFAEVEELLASLDKQRLKERNPAAVAEIKRRLDGYAAQLAAMKTEAAGSLDAVQWTRLDLALQGLVTTLHKTIGEARLKALLDHI
jgi:hypothetical protein